MYLTRSLDMYVTCIATCMLLMHAICMCLACIYMMHTCSAYMLHECHMYATCMCFFHGLSSFCFIVRIVDSLNSKDFATSQIFWSRRASRIFILVSSEITFLGALLVFFSEFFNCNEKF